MSPRTRRALTASGASVVSVLLFFLIWQVVVVAFDVPAYQAPRPLDAIRAVTSNWSTLAPLVAGTIRETFWGYLAGVAVGATLAVVMYKVRVLQYLLYPVLLFSQAVPVVALAPPLVLLFGFNLGPKILVVGWIVFFPVTVAFLLALTDTDRDLLNLARVAGAGRWRTFWLIEFPAASTGLFSGLRLGATYAVTGAIIGEMAASTGTSLAIYQQHANNNLDTASVYGTTLLMAAIGIAWFGAVVALDYVATPWKHRATAPGWWPSARHEHKLHAVRRKDS